MKNNYSIFLFLFVVISACTSENKSNSKSTSAMDLKYQLEQVSSESILFGHQDDLAYGIGWNGIKDESDVKRVAGDYPALFGWELGNIGDEENLDGVSFDSMLVYVQRVHQMGGVNTISWHARFPTTNNDSWDHTEIDVSSILPGGSNHSLFTAKLDLVADFMSEMLDEEGKLIPIIFRPWHEMYGEWFWWGTKTCSDEEFIELFTFTIDYLRIEKGLKNLLIAYAPSGNVDTREQYLSHYPGDDYVDILGLDNYGDFTIKRLDNIVQQISIVVNLANEKNKLSAFTETGTDKMQIDNWYTTNLLQVLKANDKTRRLAYVMVWRNRDLDHFYVPYPDHEQADDFNQFVNDKMIYLLSDYTNFKKSTREIK